MKNFDFFYFRDEFAIINNKIIFINLNNFYSEETFSKRLVSFLGDYCKKNMNSSKDCQILDLEFSDGFINNNVLFLYPYVDKSISFEHIFNIYVYKLNSTYIFLYIKIL